jgi:hypothetical protein
MTSVWKIMVFGLSLSAFAALGGCQSSGSAEAEGHHHDHDAVALAGGSEQAAQCDKCQITWVKVPTENGKGRVVGYSTQKRDACPDCKDAVSSFFTTGKLQHTCKTCGGNMTPCEAH